MQAPVALLPQRDTGGKPRVTHVVGPNVTHRRSLHTRWIGTDLPRQDMQLEMVCYGRAWMVKPPYACYYRGGRLQLFEDRLVFKGELGIEP